jgi:kynurenine formamidase
LDWRCASWLHDHDVAAVAADNLMVEDPISGVDGTFLPMHMLCLRDMGLMLGEYWDLTALAADCAADDVYEFQLIAPPLSIVGAVGSPVNPIAIK